MTQEFNQVPPAQYHQIQETTATSGFTMASDMLTCSLLRTLAASKLGGKFLELGTGTGLATSWILDGMDKDSTLVSIDNDENYLKIAREYLSGDRRLELVSIDGGEWIGQNRSNKFDYIFADTWHGKYLMLDEALSMLNRGGLYIIDDMLPQPNWPDGHHEKAINLEEYLDTHPDFFVTKLAWATGIIVAVRK